MKMKSFSRLARGMAVTMVAAVALGGLSGCARVETGAVGILKHWSGEISTVAQTGFTWTILDSMVGTVDTTETRIGLPDLKPADSTGVQLADLDVVLSVRINGEKVPGFFIQTKEIDIYKDESGNEVHTVGMNVVRNIGSHAINEVTKSRKMASLSGEINNYELKIKEQVQKELDAGYPGVFQIVRVNVNNLQVPEAVMKQATAMANLDMETERIEKEMSLTAKREAMQKQHALIDAKALKSAISETGLSAEQITAWKNAKSYGEQAQAMGAKAAPTLETGKQPSPK